MTHAVLPYSRERVRGIKDTSLNRVKVYGRTRHKLRSYFQIPAFSVANVWRGASEIVLRFDFDLSKLSITNSFPLTPPTGANFCPVLAWRVGDEFVRYKIWEDVGEILWLPLYNKEKITAEEFYIEIWNTDTRPDGGDAQFIGLGEIFIGLGTEFLGLPGGYGPEADIVLSEAIRFYTSRLILPTTLCAEDDVLLGEPTTCVDPIYYLEDFEPIFGDYYLLVAPCERLLVKGTKYVPDSGYNILKSSDDTWHYVWFTTNNGVITYTVDQDNTVPPEDALGYFALISVNDHSVVHKLALHVIPGGVGHTLSLQGTLDNDEETKAFMVVLENQIDSKKYGLYVSYVDAQPFIRVWPNEVNL